ncbi:hypothetical protein Dsin_003972 [Dipteronia sinensis]|uniref:NAD-dependent epimerase/dehydratase domain-containing protein n=1 Tax=Dipteronia sinensis TaxID=43782 RepID=A0AAE0B8J9_9ROSI|nr:hypothetical protein Dsin_003972 [Dipteronia sinensis]
MGEEQRECVTGAGGYLASWVVKSLLLEGYVVHGTVRDPSNFSELVLERIFACYFPKLASFEFVLFSGDNKNAHLMKLEKASENLKLFKTDLLDYEGLCAAIDGCVGVFHIASPVPLRGSVINLQELMQPAITGTKNVLNACLKAKVKKVVVVSSTGAVVLNPNWPKDRSMDEECWSDLESCNAIQNWYCVAKTIAEREALEYVKRGELNIVTVCPSIIIGPLLQSTMNSSSLYFLKFLRDGCQSADNGVRAFVDVRDAAAAILLVYDKAEAEGRYILSSHEIGTQDLVKKLKSFYPNYNYPQSFNEVETKMNVSSVKLQNLGWKYRPLEETLVDAVNNYEETGALFITSSLEPRKSSIGRSHQVTSVKTCHVIAKSYT